MERKIYLDNRPLEEALEKYMGRLEELGVFSSLPAEEVPVEESLGRITAQGVFAARSVPHYHSAAMDGIAVRSESTYGASQIAPKELAMPAEAVFIDTGKRLPEGFDSVIRIEDVHFPREDAAEITAAAPPWQYVRTVGEDLVKGDLLLPTNHRIRPVDVGAMLAGGIEKVLVRRRPKVVVIPTGSDLALPRAELQPGEIPEFNSHILGLTLEEWGAKWIRWGIVPDDVDLLRAAVEKALEQGDVVLVNAGSSAGSKDYTAHVIEELGEVLVHGVGIRPGKPVVLGAVRGAPVLGIPGYPVSAHLTLELFVRPILSRMMGQAPSVPEKVKARLARRVVSPLGMEEFVRVRLGEVKGQVVALPMGRGAGNVSSLVKADGLLRVPRLSQGLEADEEVEVELFCSRQQIEKTILVAGSHDLTLDIVADFLGRGWPDLRLASAHVGSTAGLAAIKRGQAHLAGCHLLDEETGEYNIPYLQRLLPDVPVALVNLAYRQQGIIIQPGNPKGIQGLEDLARPDIQFVNRQRGAGTRVLLDLKLKELGIDPRSISGYEREEFTHMAVAAAVANGVAHMGLGIYSAAKALGLDFIPLAKERYDLVVEQEFFQSELMERLLAILRSQDFQETVLELGGYDLSDCGRLLYSTV
ncbi:MAG: molybdopterin biosynthesis protein [Firmicutes bacterium]|nr:molybdopterin biosynthesis protein [Bacillota bacterium]